jgi:hypothetical protein
MFQRPAPLAAIPMLAAGYLSKKAIKILMNVTKLATAPARNNNCMKNPLNNEPS